MNISPDVMSVLEMAKVEGNKLFLVGQLDRNLYQRVNKVLNAAGGVWKRKEGAHVFDKCAETRVDEMITTGQVECIKKDFNFFPTPDNVVQELIAKSNLSGSLNILEPSAGVGAIAVTLAEQGHQVDCIELNEDNFKSLFTRLGTLRSVERANFLAIQPKEVYDRVIMNPPFSKQQDIDHVLHALKFVKPGGQLTAIMSASVMTRENQKTKAFRVLVNQHNGSFTPLPDSSFKASGTLVNTVIVTIPK